MFITGSLISAFTILVPSILVDSYFYGRLVLAPLNIVLYNVFSEHGPDLYGTSPWTYYFLNGFLNFNFVFILSIVSLPVLMITWKLKPIQSRRIPFWLVLIPLYLWILVFFTRPHKEERFLYPVYPLIGLTAALTWTCLESLMKKLTIPAKLVHWLILALVASSSVLSISRVVGQFKGYHAPIDVFLELDRLSWQSEVSTTGVNVCIGKEWHRFPSSFFLPNNWSLRYLSSEFRGQLPRPFEPYPNGTWILPPNMNDLNKEEPSRYVPINECHYLIDSDSEIFTGREPRYSRMVNEWDIVYQVAFHDNSRPSQLFRAFYIPWFSDNYCNTIPYVLLKRRLPEREKWQ